MKSTMKNKKECKKFDILSWHFIGNNAIITLAECASAGTGRQARLRGVCLWRTSSSLVSRTKFETLKPAWMVGFGVSFFIFDQQIDQQFYKIDQRYGMVVFWVLSKYIRERFTDNCNRTGGRQGENGGCVRKSYRLRFQWFVQSLKEPLRICSSRF